MAAILGIVVDVHHKGPEIAPAPEMRVPWGQVPNVEIRPAIVVRYSAELASLASALRKAVAEVDPEVPMDQVAPMDPARLEVRERIALPRYRVFRVRTPRAL